MKLALEKISQIIEVEYIELVSIIESYKSVFTKNKIEFENYWTFNPKIKQYELTKEGCYLICSHLKCRIDNFDYYKNVSNCLNVLCDTQNKLVSDLKNVIDIAIKNGYSYDIKFIAKIIQTYNKDLGPKGLYDYLRRNRILIDNPKGEDHNVFYNKYSRYFNLKVSTVNLNGFDRVYYKSNLTHEGVIWLINKLINDGLLKNNIGILKIL